MAASPAKNIQDPTQSFRQESPVTGAQHNCERSMMTTVTKQSQNQNPENTTEKLLHLGLTAVSLNDGNLLRVLCMRTSAILSLKLDTSKEDLWVKWQRQLDHWCELSQQDQM
ncbi:uncharacterized protein LOC144243064 [Crocuta crocuta]